MNDTAMKFDLQLFADPSAALNNTSGTMTAEMKTFYEKRLIDQAEPRLVHDQFADYYPVPQNGGKTIEFRKYDSLPKASTPLTEGVTPDGQALNVTTITSDLHQYGGWTPLTDVLQMTAIDNNVVQATRVLASQAGRTMDSITRDVLAGGTNVIYAPKLGADGAETAVTSRKALDKSCTLTPKLFFQAAAQLGAMNADPIGDSYVAIIHPYAAYDLKTCKEFMEVHKYADPETKKQVKTYWLKKPMPHFDGAAILHIREDSWELIRVHNLDLHAKRFSIYRQDWDLKKELKDLGD
mgnify:CR=1 FL=1